MAYNCGMSEKWFEPLYFEWSFLTQMIAEYDAKGVYSVTSSDVLGYLVNRAYRKGEYTLEGLAEAAGTGTRFIEDILAGQPRYEYHQIGNLLHHLGIAYDYLEVPGYETERAGADWRAAWSPKGWASQLETIESNALRSDNTPIIKPGGALCLGTNL